MFINIIPNTYISANLVDTFYTFFQNKFRRLLHYFCYFKTMRFNQNPVLLTFVKFIEYLVL